MPDAEGALPRELSEQTTTLVCQELQVAKPEPELTEKGNQAGMGVGMLGRAGIVGFMRSVR